MKNQSYPFAHRGERGPSRCRGRENDWSPGKLLGEVEEAVEALSLSDCIRERNALRFGGRGVVGDDDDVDMEDVLEKALKRPTLSLTAWIAAYSHTKIYNNIHYNYRVFNGMVYNSIKWRFPSPVAFAFFLVSLACLC